MHGAGVPHGLLGEAAKVTLRAARDVFQRERLRAYESGNRRFGAGALLRREQASHHSEPKRCPRKLYVIAFDVNPNSLANEGAVALLLDKSVDPLYVCRVHLPHHFHGLHPAPVRRRSWLVSRPSTLTDDRTGDLAPPPGADANRLLVEKDKHAKESRNDPAHHTQRTI